MEIKGGGSHTQKVSLLIKDVGGTDGTQLAAKEEGDFSVQTAPHGA